jgi:hypothetical protein
MRLDNEQAQVLRERGTVVEVRLDGEIIPNETLVLADDEAGIIERFVGQTAETERVRGHVKIRCIESMGVQVHESIKAGDGV